jgi:hypothetical protein
MDESVERQICLLVERMSLSPEQLSRYIMLEDIAKHVASCTAPSCRKVYQNWDELMYQKEVALSGDELWMRDVLNPRILRLAEEKEM